MDDQDSSLLVTPQSLKEKLRAVPSKCLYILRNTIIEPVAFLEMLASNLIFVVEQTMFVDRVCRVNMQYPDDVCDNLHDDVNKDLEENVQKHMTQFLLYNNLVMNLIPVFFALFFGSWSDRHGRKIPILIALFGKVLQAFGLLLNAYFTNWPVEYVLFTATLPFSLFGGYVSMSMSLFSYMSDSTSFKSRTMRYAFLDAAFYLSSPVGTWLGSVLYNVGSFSTVFCTSVFLNSLALVYVVLRVKETPIKRRAQEANSNKNCCKETFDVTHVRDTFQETFRKTGDKKRTYLVLLIISTLLYVIPMKESEYRYLYVQNVFDWGNDEYSYFKVFEGTTGVVVTTLAVPLLTSCLGIRDTIVSLIGAVFSVGGRMCYAVAHVPWVFYLGALIYSVHGINPIAIRSLMSKITPQENRGKMFALMGAFEAAVPLVTGTLTSQLYYYTLDTAPNSIFFLSTGLAFLQVVIFIYMDISMRSNGLDKKLASNTVFEAEDTILSTDNSLENINEELEHSSPISIISATNN